MVIYESMNSRVRNIHGTRRNNVLSESFGEKCCHPFVLTRFFFLSFFFFLLRDQIPGMANAGRRWKEREAYGEKDKMKRWIAKREKERGRILRERGCGREKGRDEEGW